MRNSPRSCSDGKRLLRGGLYVCARICILAFNTMWPTEVSWTFVATAFFWQPDKLQTRKKRPENSTDNEWARPRLSFIQSLHSELNLLLWFCRGIHCRSDTPLSRSQLTTASLCCPHLVVLGTYMRVTARYSSKCLMVMQHVKNHNLLCTVLSHDLDMYTTLAEDETSVCTASRLCSDCIGRAFLRDRCLTWCRRRPPGPTADTAGNGGPCYWILIVTARS